MQVRKTFRWALDSFIRMAGPKASRSEYVVITPPFFRFQRVMNKRTRVIMRYEMRDPVDLSVLYQTFLDDVTLANEVVGAAIEGGSTVFDSSPM